MPRTTSLTCETIIVTDQLQTTQSIKQKISRQVNIEYILLTLIFIFFPRYYYCKYRVVWLFQFFRIKVLKISLYSFLCKNSPTLSTIVGNPTPRDCNLNKNISILHEDASTQVSAFLAKWFSQNNIIKECSLFIPISKCQTDAGQKFSLGELKTRQPYYQPLRFSKRV